VPTSVPLPDACEQPVLACGAELKSTFCLARGSHAWVSHHIGDLENYETLRSFTDGIAHFERLFAISPNVIAHDLHPEYLSTKYALDREDGQLIGVQHHHAHLAACLAEHGEQGIAIGAIFDGTGFGPDGTIWGGELLLGDLGDFCRVGMLLPVPLPGGHRAISEPWRMACAWLMALADRDGADHAGLPRTLRPHVTQRTWEQVGQLTVGSRVSPLTSSVGRLFDAVAALCGLRARVSYEGQAAVELEAACDPAEHDAYPISLERCEQLLVIDPRPTIAALVRDIGADVTTGIIASRFHAALSNATVQALADAAAVHRCETVVLAGGVFQNRRMLESVSCAAARVGLRVLTPERLPIGDGGISYGQAAIAARRISRPTPGRS
jgi:hydrogenase maturation protein HypF